MAENLFLSSCSDGHLEKVKAALQEGVDINTKDQSTNRTGLMKALIFHQNPVARVLLLDWTATRRWTSITLTPLAARLSTVR